MKNLFYFCLFVASLGLVQPALAQGSAKTPQASADLVSTLSVTRAAVAASGKEVNEPASTAKPGDVLEYTVDYRNSGKSAVRQLQATLPVPAGTEFILNSARPSGAMASLDGVQFENIPLKKRTQQADGKVVEQLVPYAQYRFLRWPAQDLAAGKNVAYVAQAKVSQDPAGGESKK